MPDALGINYRLEIEVLTPLHIGSGVTLKQGFDFEVSNGLTYRLNEDIILADKWPSDPAQQRLYLNQPLANLLETGDYRAHPEYFRYTLRGAPAMKEIREAIRDVQGRPYIPGSSLKGALRTALLRGLTSKQVFQRGDFGPSEDPREAKAAASRLEKSLLGRDPNRDVLRAIQMSDSSPVSTAALTLQQVQMVPGLNIDVEAIQRGTRLTATLRIDTWLLQQSGQRGLEWTQQVTDYTRRITEVAQHIAIRRLQHEWQYHANRKDAAVATFYDKLFQEANSDAWPKDEFFLQVGFATGWRAKTVLGGLSDEDPLLEQIVHDFNLDRGGGGQSRGYTCGEPFPKARHLAWVGNAPALPLGWLLVTVVQDGQEVAVSDWQSKISEAIVSVSIDHQTIVGPQAQTQSETSQEAEAAPLTQAVVTPQETIAPAARPAPKPLIVSFEEIPQIGDRFMGEVFSQEGRALELFVPGLDDTVAAAYIAPENNPSSKRYREGDKVVCEVIGLKQIGRIWQVLCRKG